MTKMVSSFLSFIFIRERNFILILFFGPYMSLRFVFISLAGIISSASESSPAHYTVRLQSLSLLAKNNIEKYSTSEFEAAGYKWYTKN